MQQDEVDYKRKKYLADYRAKNRARKRKEGAQWRKDNPDYFKKYYATHRDKLKTRAQARYIEHRETCLAQVKALTATGRYSEVRRIRQQRDRALRPQVHRARKILGRAVKAGLIIRGNCEVCGVSRVDAHHDSYEPGNELKVRWLCRYHHRLHEGKILVPRAEPEKCVAASTAAPNK